MKTDAGRRRFVADQVGLCEIEEINCSLGALATLLCMEGTLLGSNRKHNWHLSEIPWTEGKSLS